MSVTAEQRLAQLELNLPRPPKPVANYLPMVIVGNLAFVSGHGPLGTDGSLICGKVGQDLTEAEGYAAARVTGLAVLASLRNQLGSLDRVARLVKVLGMVNCVPTFDRHPFVINGFSDLMVELFGDSGRGARSAVGMASLPSNMAIEVEAIFQVT